jgi:hypothetical protein
MNNAVQLETACRCGEKRTVYTIYEVESDCFRNAFHILVSNWNQIRFMNHS